MVMRVSENSKFNTMINNLFKVQTRYNDLMDKMSSQKNINKPSDDPLGMSMVMRYRESQSAITNYRRNTESAKAWISMSESKLSSVNDLLVKAREIAVSQSTATATSETREYGAVSIQQIMDEMLSLANATYGDRYLFAGTKMDAAPFSETESTATVGSVVNANENGGFDGTAVSGGTFTGTVNKTYVVKIVSDDQVLANTQYQVSDDGGKTWGAIRNDLTDGIPVTIGDDIQMTFNEGTTTNLAENDILYIHASTAGYYNGNGEELSVEIGKEVTFDYSLPGESVFTDQGDGEIDIFKVLKDLETALSSNDPDGIFSQMDNLEMASEQVNKYIAKCGTRINRLEIANSNLTDLDFKLTELISNKEDADMAELVTQFSMQEIVLKASYSMASSISNISIIDFLR